MRCYVCLDEGSPADPVERYADSSATATTGGDYHASCAMVAGVPETAKILEVEPEPVDACEACGRAGDRTNPTSAYLDGARYHDQRADDAGISEEEMP